MAKALQHGNAVHVPTPARAGRIFKKNGPPKKERAFSCSVGRERAHRCSPRERRQPPFLPYLQMLCRLLGNSFKHNAPVVFRLLLCELAPDGGSNLLKLPGASCEKSKIHEHSENKAFPRQTGGASLDHLVRRYFLYRTGLLPRCMRGVCGSRSKPAKPDQNGGTAVRRRYLRQCPADPVSPFLCRAAVLLETAVYSGVIALAAGYHGEVDCFLSFHQHLLQHCGERGRNRKAHSFKYTCRWNV